jgi:putative membrane-bound dehydrogenase-like protein
LLVIESQTHFRPKDWQGPAHDQIVWLKDTDSDGRADAREVIFDQTDATMDIASHPDGSVYLSTRSEILRLRDQDNDGKYEKIDRRMVWLETEGKYPHNGLSGLAFDAKGDLHFGMGENLGAAYTIQGTDGASFSDQGEGGNVWHCTAEGKKLKRVATGFWNPFGVCVDPWGNVFATDNDPDSSPPCRLHHVVEGGDYGYQFRYGRSGLHPFISWNGELPGTLPMLAGTGESPCDVICYAPTAGAANRALGEKWQGTLLVASWVDHRIESYKLTPKDGSFASKMTLLVEGGQDFRPVAFATAPDGSLFVSDWVKRDYELHGKGRVWRISARQASAQPVAALKPDAANAEAELRERILSGPTPSDEEVAQWLKLTKPYLVSAVIWRMAREGEQLRGFAAQTLGDVGMDATVLLAARAALKREGVELSPLATQMIGRGLAHSDPKMQLLALKWISDERLAPFRPLVEARLKDHALTAPVYYAVLTTLARLESAETNEAALVKRLMEDIASPSVPPQRKMLALEILPDRDKYLKAADLVPLMIKAAPSYKTWLVNYLGTLYDVKRFESLYQIAFDANENALVRAAALMHGEVKGADVPALIDLLVSDETRSAQQFRLDRERRIGLRRLWQ